MSNEKKTISLIHRCKLFSSLSLSVCEKVSELFENVTLTEGDILFEQDSPSDYFYILVNGSLSASIRSKAGDKFIGHIEEGETVGELGAISGEPRTLTVKAVKHSRLLRLANQEFIKLSLEYPSILLEIVKPVISRSQKNIKMISTEKNCTINTILFGSINNPEQVKKLFRKHALNTDQTIYLQSSELDKKNAWKEISELEKRYEFINVFLNIQDDISFDFLYHKSRNIYIVVDAINPDFSAKVKEIIHNEEISKKANFELVLCHSPSVEFPSSTINWLKRGNFLRHHHLKKDNELDYQRVLRYVCGNPIGLVLGGGGMRSWLSGGVIKALLEKNIPIDALGGTSAGSFLSGFYLLSKGNLNQLVELFHSMNQKTSPPFDPKELTIPIISILSSKRVTTAFQELYENFQIEDMWLPFFCVSSNFTHQKENIHFTGSLHEKIRASIAIPGIMPPMIINEEMHYDGALCNNLPVDIMKDFLGPRGKTIAVSLMKYKEKMENFYFPPVLTPVDIIKNRLFSKTKRYNFPSFLDIMLKVTLFGSYYKENDNSKLADILVAPDISRYNPLGVTKAQEKELMNLGYQETLNKIKGWDYTST